MIFNFPFMAVLFVTPHVLKNAINQNTSRTEQNKTFILQLNSGHTQVAYEIKHYICQKQNDIHSRHVFEKKF